jgi:hypothetical protein
MMEHCLSKRGDLREDPSQNVEYVAPEIGVSKNNALTEDNQVTGSLSDLNSNSSSNEESSWGRLVVDAPANDEQADPPGDPPRGRVSVDINEKHAAVIDLSLVRIRDSDVHEKHAAGIDRNLVRTRDLHSIPSLEPISISQLSEMNSSTCSLRSVQFDTVEVRKHAYTLGSGSRYPGGVSGPRMELSWEVLSTSISTVDEYEASRGPRRSPKTLYKSEMERLRILKEAGFGSEEIRAAAASTEAIRTGRDDEEEQFVSTLDAPLYGEFLQRFKAVDQKKKKRAWFRGRQPKLSKLVL